MSNWNLPPGVTLADIDPKPTPTVRETPPKDCHRATQAQRESAAEEWWKEEGKALFAKAMGEENGFIVDASMQALASHYRSWWRYWRDGQRMRNEEAKGMQR